MLWCQLTKRFDCQGFLRGLGAAREKHGVFGAEASQLGKSGDLSRIPLTTDTVVFHRASDEHFRGPQLAKSCGIFFAPRDHQRQPLQHPAGERCDAAVATKTPFTHAGVDDHNRDATCGGKGQQLRPQFQFAEHQKVGPHPVENAADGPTEVEGTGKHEAFAKPCLSDFEPCGGRTRGNTFQGCLLLLSDTPELGSERSEQCHLTHAHTVEPEALTTCRIRQLRATAGGALPEGSHRPATGTPTP